MKGVLNFSDFIKENKLNEGNKSSDLFDAVYDNLKKLNKSSISVPPTYQTHDKDMYFDFVANGILNVGTIFFAVTLLSTVLFGRWFCGWACHVVLLQDWCYALMRKLGIRPKPFRARILMWFPLGLGLYMFVWPLFYRFVILKLPFPTVRTEFVTEEYWSSFASPIVAIPFLLISKDWVAL